MYSESKHFTKLSHLVPLNSHVVDQCILGETPSILFILQRHQAFFRFSADLIPHGIYYHNPPLLSVLCFISIDEAHLHVILTCYVMEYRLPFYLPSCIILSSIFYTPDTVSFVVTIFSNTSFAVKSVHFGQVCPITTPV